MHSPQAQPDFISTVKFTNVEKVCMELWIISGASERQSTGMKVSNVREKNENVNGWQARAS